jgi:hypothetical protein
MSLLTVNLDDIHIIDCGKYGAFKGVPKHKPFLLLQDFFLIGKHEVCLTDKEIFGSSVVTPQRFKEGMAKFFKELFESYLEPGDREGIVVRVLGKRDAGDKGQIFISLIREEFDEVKFSDIIELEYQRIPPWWGRKMICITFQGGSILFVVWCRFTGGVMVISDNTKEAFGSIQNAMNTYRRRQLPADAR